MNTEASSTAQTPAQTTRQQSRSSVKLEDVLNFVFPPHLQHPLSLGRLYSFAMHGPLDDDNQLRGGGRRSRVLSTLEVDIICKAFEREDIVRIYLFEGRPLHMLTSAQQEELIAQADSKLKNAKGRGMMRQLTREEVVKMFEELPTDEDGGYSFHDMQARIEAYREQRIADAKVVFPLMSKPTTENSPASVVRASSALTRMTTTRNTKKKAPSRRMNDIELRAHEARLLATRAFKVCELETSNDPGVVNNVRLMRHEDTTLVSKHRNKWDTTSCLNGTQVGSRVKCIPHGTR